MVLRFFTMLAGLSLLSGCSGNKPRDPINLKTVTLPGGQQVFAEIMMTREDMMHGMMFRAALAEDRALLFIHPREDKQSYWMHNVRVPLDIIWMDRTHRIVEISADTPPCLETDPIKCPHYGGNARAMFVIELAGGMAKKYGLQVGQTLNF